MTKWLTSSCCTKHNIGRIAILFLFFSICAIAGFSTQAKGHGILMHQVMILNHDDQVSFLAWSPDSSKLAVSSRNDTTITLWDLTSESQLWKIKKLLGVNVGGKDLEFGPGGSTIITGSATSIGSINFDEVLSVISTKTGEIIYTVKEHNHDNEPVRPWNLILSPDRNKLFVAVGDRGKIFVYEAMTWRKVGELGPVISHYRMFGGAGRPGGIRRLAFDEKHNLLLVSVSDGRVETWDVLKNVQALEFQPFQVDVTDMVLNPIDGELIVGGSGAIVGYPKFSPPAGSITPETMLYVQDDSESLVEAWNPLIGKQLRSYRGPGNTAATIAVSPDGRLIAAGKERSLPESSASYVVIWDAKSGASLGAIDCGQAMMGGIAFSPDGTLLAYSTDNTVHIVSISKE